MPPRIIKEPIGIKDLSTLSKMQRTTIESAIKRKELKKSKRRGPDGTILLQPGLANKFLNRRNRIREELESAKREGLIPIQTLADDVNKHVTSLLGRKKYKINIIYRGERAFVTEEESKRIKAEEQTTGLVTIWKAAERKDMPKRDMIISICEELGIPIKTVQGNYYVEEGMVKEIKRYEKMRNAAIAETITGAKAAKILKIPGNAFWKLWKSEEIPYKIFGNDVRFDEGDILEYKRVREGKKPKTAGTRGVDKAAELLGMTKFYLRTLISRGLIKSRSIGGSIRINDAEIERIKPFWEHLKEERKKTVDRAKAAPWLGVSIREMNRLLNNGTLPYRIFWDSVRIDRKDIKTLKRKWRDHAKTASNPEEGKEGIKRMIDVAKEKDLEAGSLAETIQKQKARKKMAKARNAILRKQRRRLEEQGLLSEWFGNINEIDSRKKDASNARRSKSTKQRELRDLAAARQYGEFLRASKVSPGRKRRIAQKVNAATPYKTLEMISSNGRTTVVLYDYYRLKYHQSRKQAAVIALLRLAEEKKRLVFPEK